ncbi:TIGR02300 family protein [Elioraea tepida]|jgi:uncharacterized protein (TIGR02300 family)|uniref:TIGR02300 family protein n=1 Tax=Elioraea tepida TaxID=2843330 RepID=A0A975YI80_9PROT|nr:TIGR02300 family protein [Elioraea tepida]QXM23365.1 TIGR02300 family protein [Elioraea tepida]
MAKPELGLKRVCVACNAKFYDLMRSPAVCPKCGTEQPAELPRARRAAAVPADARAKRPAAAPVPEDVELEVVADEAEDDAVLEDADELEDSPDELAADIEVEPNENDEDR